MSNFSNVSGSSPATVDGILSANIASICGGVVSAPSTVFSVTIPSGTVSSNLTNFPVMVRLSDMPADFWTTVRTDGGNVRAKTTGGTLIPLDLARFDYGAHDGVLFFLASTVYSGSDNVWHITVEDSSTQLLPYTDTNGRNAVWANYKAVYLFGETPENRTGNDILKVNGDPNLFKIASTSPDLDVHQGVASDNSYYYVADTNALKKYDLSWNLVTSNTNPIGDTGLSGVNHLSDIECYDGKLYSIAEIYPNSPYNNQHIVVFNAADLSFITSYNISAQGHEGSSITYCPTDGYFYITDYTNGAKLYKYSTTGTYIGYLTLTWAPGGAADLATIYWQGITWWRGAFWLTSDAYDEVYRVLEDGTVQWSGLFGNTVSGSGYMEGIGKTHDALLVLTDDGTNQKVDVWKPNNMTTGAGGGVEFSGDTARYLQGDDNVTGTTVTLGVSFAIASKAQNRCAMSYWRNTYDNVRATISYSTTQNSFGVWDNSNGWLLPSPAIDPVLNTEYRVHVTYAGTTSRKIYVDGALKNTANTITALPTTLDTLLFGREDASYLESMQGMVGFAYLVAADLGVAWLAAEVANIKTPSSFYSVGVV